MTKTIAVLTATALIASAALAPAAAAHAQQVSVRIDTPEFGVRIGTPYPAPIHAPVYAPVYAPPLVVAPAPVYYAAPRYVVHAPRVIVPQWNAQRAPWFAAPGHARAHWQARHRDWD